MKMNLFAATCSVLLALSMAGCDLFPQETPSPQESGSGTLAIDINNRVFADDEGEQEGYSRRLGADSVEIYINSATTPTQTLLAADMDESDTAEGYTRVSVSYTGTLESVRLVATGANAYIESSNGVYSSVDSETYEDTISEIGLLSDLEGISSFAAVEKIKMFPSDSYSTYSDIGINIVCAPCWMTSPSVYTSESSAYLTERSLTSGQIEIHPSWSENPEGMTIDVYMVSSEYTKLSDLSTAEGWSTAWTYDQITSTGRTVGGTLYTMTKQHDASLDAVYLGGDEMRSFLIEGLDSTAYYYIAIISHFGNGSCYSAVKEIQVP